MQVGVLGLGGLGHLALQFAAAVGAEVYALSGSKGKEEEARKLGAKHFLRQALVCPAGCSTLTQVPPGAGRLLLWRVLPLPNWCFCRTRARS